MREILFRGKRKDNGEWIYGSYVNQYGAHEIYLPEGIDSEHGSDHYTIVPETVGQFIGLIDENGNKIFEGDIIKSRACECEDEYDNNDPLRERSYLDYCDTVYVVKRFGHEFYQIFKITPDEPENILSLEMKFEYCGVIGNIYDNPELIEK